MVKIQYTNVRSSIARMGNMKRKILLCGAVYHFCTLVEDRSYYVVPSVCLSVNFSCPFYNFNTVENIIMKLLPNLNQTICRENKTNRNSIYIFNETMPLRIFSYENRGWSGGARELDKLPVPGRPTILITVGQGLLRLQ